MSIYTSVNYRKIYEDYFGPIPKGHDIHHIDGDRNNNDISNLLLVTKQQHYDIHYGQGDWGACFALSQRINISPAEKSRLASLDNANRIANGTHHFLGSSNNQKRVADGTHNFLGGTLQSANNKKRVSTGTHHLLGGEVQRASTNKLLAEGRHASQIKKTCEYCGTTCSSNNFSKWHGDNCRKK